MAVDNLEQLPDDVLVAALQYLAERDLLACRLVSRRLGGLVLHPDVWRHRSLSADYGPYANAVLRLAPCLDTLWGTWNIRRMSTTTCAVRKLEIGLAQGQVRKGITTELLAATVRNQEALGRLKGVDVSLGHGATDVDELLVTLAATSRLQSLEVLGQFPAMRRAVERGPPTPSVKQFCCQLTRHSESFCNTVLGAHAATLEYVELLSYGSEQHLSEYGSVQPYSGEPSGSTARVLARMGRLQVLHCACLPGLEALAACGALRNLKLRVYPGAHQRRQAIDLAPAQHLLRYAPRLEEVSLDLAYMRDRDAETVAARELLEALVLRRPGLGVHAVQTLCVGGLRNLQPLLDALPGLRGLRCLEVQAPLDNAVLRSLRPHLAPELKVLRLQNLFEFNMECAHAWMHGPAARGAIAANPTIHIEVPHVIHCGRPMCEWCRLGCHQMNEWSSHGFVLFSQHDVSDCKFPEYHSAVD